MTRSSDIARDLVDRIATDRVNGASRLARLCLEGIIDYTHARDHQSPGRYLRDLQQLTRELGEVRPSMLTIENQLRVFDAHLREIPDQHLEATRSPSA